MGKHGEKMNKLLEMLQKKQEKSHKEYFDYGDIFILPLFTQYCEDTTFIDYDGHGYFCDEDGGVDKKDYGVAIIPSEFLAGKHKTDKTHIVWFNR